MLARLVTACECHGTLQHSLHEQEFAPPEYSYLDHLSRGAGTILPEKKVSGGPNFSPGGGGQILVTD